MEGDVNDDTRANATTTTNNSYFIDQLFNVDLFDKVLMNPVRNEEQNEAHNCSDNDSLTLEDIRPDQMVDERQFY